MEYVNGFNVVWTIYVTLQLFQKKWHEKKIRRKWTSHGAIHNSCMYEFKEYFHISKPIASRSILKGEPIVFETTS